MTGAARNVGDQKRGRRDESLHYVVLLRGQRRIVRTAEAEGGLGVWELGRNCLAPLPKKLAVRSLGNHARNPNDRS